MERKKQQEKVPGPDFDPFAGPQIIRVVPAIEPQVEIWLSCKLGGDDANRSYNESLSLFFTGSLNRAALESAIQQVIQRHESLRSSFSADGKQICIFEDLPAGLRYFDLSDNDKQSQRQALDDFAVSEAQLAFDLLNGPLFRFSLFKMSEQAHCLTLTVHHIVCDGWSLGILLQDISRYYNAYPGIASLEPTTAFTDFAIEHAAFLETPAYAEIEKFWKDQYTDIPLVDLPADFPRPALRTYGGRRDDYPLDGKLVRDLKAIGATSGSSLVTTLLAAFEVFLYHYTGSRDIVLGLPAAAQPATGNFGMIGHCVNLLPLRSKIDRDESFSGYLARRRTYIFDAYEHQLITFGSLIKTLKLPRDPSRVPLVPIVFNIDIGLDKDVKFNGLRHELVQNPRAYETFDLFLNASGSETDLTLQWSYNTSLFTSSTIRGMMDGFEHLLREITRAPLTTVGRLSIAEEQTIAALPVEDTHMDYPRDTPVHQLVHQMAGQFPDKVAIRYNAQRLTYRMVDEKVAQLAAFLKSQEVKKGDVVGVALYRSPEMVILFLAVLAAGGTYLPVDPAIPKDRADFMLQDAGVKLLVTSKQYRQHGNENVTKLYIEDFWSSINDESAESVTDVPVSGDDIAYVLYTSGSTGKPKGVQVRHRNLVNILFSAQQMPGFDDRDVLLGVTIFSFDISGIDIYLPLISGGELHMTNIETARDGSLLLDAIKSVKPTFMQATPATWRMLLEAGWTAETRIATICSSGEALPRELAMSLLARCDSLYNMYGPTETTIWSTGKKIERSDSYITIGKPVGNTQVYICDETGNQVPPGHTGELVIAGDGVAKGYLNRPELNEKHFIPNPYSGLPGDTMYRTGDLGKYLPSGEIDYLGRLDQQVKIRGYRIEPGEIEEILVGQAEIRQVVVIAREDRPGDQRLVAYVVPEIAVEAGDQQEMVHHWKEILKTALPPFMIPNDFVFLSVFPLTSSGKIDRKALPAPTPAPASPTKYVAPLTDVEKMVADIWAEALGMEQVSIYDDFFELGGHSLIAVRIMARLEKETGRRLPLAILFEHPTVVSLSYALKMDAKFITWNSLVPLKPGGSKTTLYIVHGGGLNVLLFNTLARNMHPDQPVYALQAKGLNGIDEPLDRMEDIAAHYISEILTNNPVGPYALAGYSFGGIIAFEMAKQMKAMGKEVQTLALFDTYADTTDKYDSALKKLFNRIRFFIMQVLFSFVLLAEDPIGTVKYKSESIKRRIISLYWKLKRVKGKDDNQIGFFGYVNKIDEKNAEASYHYVLKPYDGEVHLFKAKKRTFYMDDFKFMGWKPYALKGVNVHDIPGAHNYLFAPPNDKYFASVLQKCLDDAAAAARKTNEPT